MNYFSAFVLVNMTIPVNSAKSTISYFLKLKPQIKAAVFDEKNIKSLPQVEAAFRGNNGLAALNTFLISAIATILTSFKISKFQFPILYAVIHVFL